MIYFLGIGALVLGSLGIAVVVTFQNWLYDTPSFITLLKFAVYTTPIMIVANAFLFHGFQVGVKFARLASIVAFQTGIYLFILSVFGALFFKENISIHTFIGVVLVATGAYIMNL